MDYNLESKKKTYLEKAGVRCLNCGSYDIEGGSITVDEGGASQDVSCLECYSTWTDLYVLTDVVNILFTEVHK